MGGARGVVVAVVVVAAAGCGGGGGMEADDGAPEQRASPFVVEVPEGFAPVVVGVGEQEQVWSSDDLGSDEPVTVLASPTEGGDRAEMVVVSTTGYRGYIAPNDRR